MVWFGSRLPGSLNPMALVICLFIIRSTVRVSSDWMAWHHRSKAKTQVIAEGGGGEVIQGTERLGPSQDSLSLYFPTCERYDTVKNKEIKNQGKKRDGFLVGFVVAKAHRNRETLFPPCFDSTTGPQTKNS